MPGVVMLSVPQSVSISIRTQVVRIIVHLGLVNPVTPPTQQNIPNRIKSFDYEKFKNYAMIVLLNDGSM